jgi:hypothetical protein
MKREGVLITLALHPGDHDDHRTLVELCCRFRMYSCTTDIAYRTARQILTKRGPVPLSWDLYQPSQ